MRSLFQVEGIVLKHFDLGEQDRIITFYTREKGKVRAVGVNLRSFKSQLMGGLDLFSHVELQIYQGRSLARIKACRPLHPFFPLRHDLLRLACASYATELVHEFSQEEDRNEDLFQLLLATLHLLTQRKKEVLELVVRVFELRSLALLGYWPVLDRCVLCLRSGEELQVAGFSPPEGGVVCRVCFHTLPQRPSPLSPGTKKLMEVLMGIDDHGLNVMKMTPFTAKQLKNLLDSYIQYYLEKDLRSRKFLDDILEMDGP